MTSNKILYTYCFLIFGLGLNYVFNLVAAKLLGTQEFGIYIYCLTLFNVAAIIANAELDKASIKFIATKKSINAYKTTIHLFGLISSFMVTLIFGILAFHFFSIELKYNLILYALAIPLFVALSISLSFLQAEHITEMRLATKYVVEPVTKLLVFVGLLYFAKSYYELKPQSEFAAAALVLALVVANVFCVCVFPSKSIMYKKCLQNDRLSELKSFIAPLCASNVIGIIAGKMDILIIGFLLVSSQTGVYGAALQTAAMLAIILQGLEMVFAPTLAENFANRKHQKLSSDYKTSLRISLLFALPLVIVFVCHSDWIMSLYGSDFTAGAPALALLALAQFCNLATGSANLLTIISGNTRIVLLTNMSYVIVSAMSIYIGTSIAGVTGAAFAVFISTTMLNIVRVLVVYKKLSIHPYSKYSLSILAAIFVTYLIFLVTHEMLGRSGIILYPLLAYLIVFLIGPHPEDVIFLKSKVFRSIKA